MNVLGLPRLRACICSLAVCSAITACIPPRSTPSGPTPGAGGGGRRPAGPEGRRGRPSEGPRPYAEVVTEEAVTDSGLVQVHHIDDTYLFEIPNEILGREILLVSRTARVPEGMGYGGLKLNTQSFRWEKRDDRIFMRIMSHTNVADDSLPVFQAVRNANFGPILKSFDIEAYNEDSTSVVIDATPLFAKDVPILGLRRASATNTGSVRSMRAAVRSMR